MQLHYKSNIFPIPDWSWIGLELDLNWSCYAPTSKKRTRFFRFPFALPPLFLLSKLGKNPIPHRLCTDFGTEEQRIYIGLTSYISLFHSLQHSHNFRKSGFCPIPMGIACKDILIVIEGGINRLALG